ncbi:hypothetical protein WKV44_07395 [Spirochaetia bacterium 38H-sp]|uniref:Uncharacterized protein n=1 Tax=Rarispira pelagica TaxID=3141764 RepID=A0ABU9UCG9_9SPIR
MSVKTCTKATILIITLLISLFSCAKKESMPEYLELPDTPPFYQELQWAVVETAYARIYLASDTDHVNWFVRRGDIYKIEGTEANNRIPILKGTEIVWIEKKDVSLYTLFLQAQYRSKVLLGEIEERK